METKALLTVPSGMSLIAAISTILSFVTLVPVDSMSNVTKGRSSFKGPALGHADKYAARTRYDQVKRWMSRSSTCHGSCCCKNIGRFCAQGRQVSSHLQLVRPPVNARVKIVWFIYQILIIQVTDPMQAGCLLRPGDLSSSAWCSSPRSQALRSHRTTRAKHE